MNQIAIAVLFAAALLTSCTCTTPVSEKSETGIITNLSDEGFVCHTHEGRMSVGFIGPGGQGTVSREEFAFTVEDEALLERLRHDQQANIPVRLQVRRDGLVMSYCRSDSGFIAFAAEELGRTP